MEKYKSLLITPLICWLLFGATTGIFNPANYPDIIQRTFAFTYLILIFIMGFLNEQQKNTTNDTQAISNSIRIKSTHRRK